MRIALVAHDARKDAMISWTQKNRSFLSACQLYSTGTTGQRIEEETGLSITKLLSGPLGGDQQIGAMIAEKRIDVLVFFIDSLSAMPHDVDVKALLRISSLHEVATATNERTAELMIHALQDTPNSLS